MRVRGGRERNPLLYRQLNDPVARVKLLHRLAPPGGGKLNRQILRANKVEGFINQTADLSVRPMTMDFDQIQMGEAINQTRRGYLTDTAKVIGVNRVDIPAFKLRGPIRHGVEHLIGAIKEMHRAQHNIELVPMPLNPVSASTRVNWVVIELDARPDSQIGIFFAQTIDLVEVDSGVITIVISESDVG